MTPVFFQGVQYFYIEKMLIVSSIVYLMHSTYSAVNKGR